MDDKTLKKLMKGIDADVKVPKNLSAKISKRVSVHAKKIERKQAVWSGVKVAVALLLAIYALTGIVVNFMSGHVWTFLKSFAEAPSLLFSSEGAIALYERLPLISALLLVAAVVYVVRHLAIRGIRKSPYVFATVMTSFAAVIVLGSFVAGMAVSSNSGDDVQQLAGSAIFDPVINTVGQHDYSNVGTVKTIVTVSAGEEGYSRVILNLANGEEKTIHAPNELLRNNSVNVGDEIAVVGTPPKPPKPESEVGSYSVEGPSLIDASTDSFDMEVQYLKVLTN